MNQQLFINRAVFVCVAILASFAVVNFTTNLRQDNEFQKKGKRFTYCDGVRLHAEQTKKTIDPYCEDNELQTDFHRYLDLSRSVNGSN